MRILLADDEVNVRSALRLLLEQQPNVSVLNEAADADGLLAALADPAAEPPDLILFDWELPGIAPAGGVARMRSLCPRARILALSGRPESYRAALAAGVDAFVSKGDPPERLVATLRILQRAPLAGDAGATLRIDTPRDEQVP